MRIAYVHQIFSLQKFGGISRYFIELAKNMSTASEDTALAKFFAPFHKNDYLEYNHQNLSFSGIKVPDIRGSGRFCHAINSFLTPFFYNNFDPDLIHHTYFACSNWKSSRAKKVITVHDMIDELFPKQFTNIDKALEAKKIAITEADHVICISENTQKDLVNILGIDIEKTSVVHLGVSLLTKNVIFTELVDRPYLLYVGSRDGYKNFSGFLKAYSNSPHIKNSFNLVAFGGGAFRPEEFATFERLNISTESVKQVSGNDALLAGYYRNASLFVYPSLYEGFGIPPLEAMSYGCPVACSNSSSIPEIVGNAATLFDPFSVESMRNCVEEVLFDNDIRSTLVTKGFERIKLFSWEKCARETHEVYKQVLQ